ncbi:uncharacterized protein [Lepeophtheirus salmonis]|uniref:uncharacterized protein isoform X2 n=1 Tax=Lepeophtheirus salmonis TaxID=72036 RepID=UPI003AF35326
MRTSPTRPNLGLPPKGLESKISGMKSQMDAITETYDELHEKMHEIDKTRKNNLIFYGVKPDFYPEIPGQLEKQIHDIFRFNLGISRDIPFIKLSRMITGPEVRGCKPVLVNFLHWKDREEILRLSKLLKGTNIYVTEDLSRKMREQRNELNKYMRTVRSRSPQKKCVLRQDKLYIDNDVFIFDDEKNSVVPLISQRYSGPNRLYYNNMTQQVQSGMSMIRSASVHSVGSHADDKEHVSAGQRYASTESLDFRTDKVDLPREKPDLKVNGRATSPAVESPSKDSMPTIDENIK